MFNDIDRKMLESVFSLIQMMKKEACEKGDFYSVADRFLKRIDNFEHDMNVRTDEINDSVEKIQGTLDEVIESNIGCFEKTIMDITHKERIELEKTIRPDIEAIKSKLGVFVGEENVKKDENGNDDSDAKYGFMLINILKLTKMVMDLDKRMEGVAGMLGKIASRCGEWNDADDDCKNNPSLSAIIDTSIDVCRLEEKMESINGKLDRFMRMFKEGVADAVNETSDKPKRRPGRRRKDA